MQKLNISINEKMEYWNIGKMGEMGKWVFRLLTIIFIVSAIQAKGQVKKLKDIRIRDPFVLADAVTGTYYLYASVSNRNNSTLGVEVYKSSDLENWEGPQTVFRVTGDFWGNRMVWAPEVHHYNGKYYLFVTFTSDKKLTQVEGRPEIVNRGSQVLVSDSPEGPFTAFANKPHTPAEWMSLDATLWEEKGRPWLIFCHEWVQITDGTIELVRLKKDLSATTGKPVTLFKATDAKWVKSLGEIGTSYQNNIRHGYVTDGPFLYRTKTGKLLMIWSSFGEEKYAVGLAESLSGKVRGPWKVVQEPLFRANGGHGMIFRALDGRLLLALHQPNNSPHERAHFFELEDTGDSLRMKNQ